MNQLKNLTPLVALKKSLLYTFYLIILSIGILFFVKSGFGTDPITLFCQGLSNAINLPLGTTILVYNMFFLVLSCTFARNNVFVGTFLAAFALGPIVNIVEPIFNSVFPQDEYSFIIRVLFLIVGVIISPIGIGMSVAVRFGLGSTDSLLFKISELISVPYKYIKMTADFIFTVVGVLLGADIGVGTVACVALMGPLIVFFAKLYNKTILKALGIQDERNEFKLPNKKEKI